MLTWWLMLGLLNIGVCLGESCNTVADCHSTNCKNFHHLGWILKCDSHTCQCSAPKSVCDSSPCHNGGRCTEDHLRTKYTCHCLSGFIGDRCQTNNHCDSNPCRNGGTCYVRNHSPFYYCNCAIGYSGYYCQFHNVPTTVAPTCSSQTCYHYGHCKPSGNTDGYTCNCLHGFSGQRCEVNTHCDSNPCKNNGTCLPHFAYPYYSCHCPRGYYGIRCDYIDKCADNPCPHGFVCRRIYSTYKCSCTHPQYCDNTAQQVDHCASQPCQHFGRCENTTEAPYYKCYCKYSFTGETCQINENCQHNTCRNNGTCLTFNRYPFYTCRCKSGYSGQHCEHFNHCLSSPCPAGTTCQSYHNHLGYLCKCTTTNCQSENKCNTNPCQNNAQCSPTITSPYYHCACPAGYSGINCASHPCDKQMCTHGTCVRTSTSPFFQCNCPLGYHGYRCEIESCSLHTCRNGGTCTPLDHKPYFTCTCLHDFYGGRCRHRRITTTSTTTTTTPLPHVQSCPPNRCYNGGTCKPINHDPFFWCACVDGFHGKLCQHRKVTTASPVVTTSPVPQGPTCLSCNEVVSPSTCEYITKCGVHENCYVDEFVTSIGSIRFSLGCRDAQVCVLNTTSVGTSHQTLWMSDCQLSSDCQQKSGQADIGSGQCQHKCCSQDICNNAC